MQKIIIALDGHSGCGKSTTARAVAKKLAYLYVDTGAMYRAATLYFIRKQVTADDVAGINQLLPELNVELKHAVNGEQEAWLNGENVEPHIRTMQISSKVSEYSQVPQIRQHMVHLQQQMGKGKGLVMDGRDIGTVVFPEAELKIFMTADVRKRAERRQEELATKGQQVELETIEENLRSRDYIDSTRTEGPLKKAEDAIELDTTQLTIDQQVQRVYDLARQQVYS